MKRQRGVDWRTLAEVFGDPPPLSPLRREARARALELWQGGKSTREIAAKLCITRGLVQELIRGNE